MDFGIVTEACLVGSISELDKNPGPEEIRNRYHEVIAEAVLADELGFDVWGTSEQHFYAPVCTIASGEIFLATVAARTKNIKLRTAISLLPFHQPARLAEQIATLDLLSRGRIEFGSGKGNSTRTAGGFGIDVRETDARYNEVMEILIRAWNQDEFSYDGKFYQIPPRRLCPKMSQRPHPPLWYAAIAPSSHTKAGRMGMGLLTLAAGVDLRQLEKRVKLYQDAIRNPEPFSDVVNDRTSVFILAHCAETTERARVEAAQPILAWLKSVIDLYETTMKAAGNDLDFTRTREITSNFDQLDQTDNVLVGDPETLIRKIARYRSIGIGEIFFRMEGLPHDQVMNSIRLIGEHVIPHFKNGLN
ncbi:MAG: LLM class flavin-dependent oxidoreductase [Acidisphaera sp.]|nr:LLM class flavin-dependent oxidoreductase [Acidisphaera sp.]